MLSNHAGALREGKQRWKRSLFKNQDEEWHKLLAVLRPPLDHLVKKEGRTDTFICVWMKRKRGDGGGAVGRETQ